MSMVSTLVHERKTDGILIRVETAEVETRVGVADRDSESWSRGVVPEVVDEIHIVHAKVNIAERSIRGHWVSSWPEVYALSMVELTSAPVAFRQIMLTTFLV
jgi:hypothetical protein